MIEIVDWKAEIGDELKYDFHGLKYDCAFLGYDNLDDRTNWAVSHLNIHAKKLERVTFDIETASLFIESQQIKLRDIDNHKLEYENVLIDATSLRIAELIYLFRIFKNSSRKFNVLYIQPKDYKKNNNLNLGYVDMFSLSEDGEHEIRSLYRYMYPMQNSKIVVSLGFEGHRYGFLLQSEDYQGASFVGIVGVPAFKTGWENRTLSSNYESMLQASGRSKYKISGANDPIETYKKIKEVYDSVEYDNHRYPDRDPVHIQLAPFGTKPMSLAMALFAINHNKIGVIYDFVKKKQKRSHGQSLVHLWTMEEI